VSSNRAPAPPLTPDDRRVLRAAAGDEALCEHAAIDIDGAALAWTLEPPDADALARALRVLAARALPVVVRGGGSRLAYGNPPVGARLLLSTRALDGIVEFDAAEGVLCAAAGTPLQTLRDAVDGSAWELPFDPPGARSTLGGVLATAAVGPRHAGFGRPRDLVLGLDVVLGDGLRARCGGRVVKNVTGYDLMKLHVGGLGAFGVLASAWLRLRPRPASVRVLSAPLGSGADLWPRALAAARLPSVRAAALIDPSLAVALEPSRPAAAGGLLLVELAGDDAAVARDARLLEAPAAGTDMDVRGVAAHEASPGAIGRLRALQGETFGPVGLRFRLAILPDRLADVSGRLERAGAALLSYPASGLVFARFSLERDVDAAGVDVAWRAARDAARAGGGFAVLEAAPPWAKSARDVFGDAGDDAALLRALKHRFDPAGILNPPRPGPSRTGPG
jgi:glycolate oxidase FAD binding subunit